MDYEYIESVASLERAVERLSGAGILGVDTEAAGYHRYHDRLSLIQITSGEGNLLIDPLAVEDVSALGTLFDDGRVEKIFHDADFDLRILDRDAELGILGLFDTQVAAAFVGERSLGLGAIVEKYLGISMPKAYQRADWAERPLTEGMKEYAAMDTAHLPALRDRLLAELERLGRTEWAKEEFARREEIRWVEPADRAEAFLRIKGARDLTPRGLAVLRELHAWREGVAEERDQATFRVLGNQSLIEMSLRPPQGSSALRAIKGLSPGLAGRRGGEILAAVERGLAVPEGELPAFPRPRRWDRDPEVEDRSERLRQLRNRLADELDLDPGFLISRSTLDEVARRAPRSLEELGAIEEIRRWQVGLLGNQLLGAIDG